MELTVSSGALLTGAPENLVQRIKEELTFDNPRYRDARKYGRWIGKRLQPRLHFFEEKGDGLHFPRGFAGRAVLLCRQITGAMPVIIDNRRTLPPVDLHFTGSLRDYQETACQALLRRDFGVLEAGTGSGKTVMALAAIARRRQPTLILVHTKELLYQWQDRIAQFLGVQPALAGDGHLESGPLTVGIVNTVRNHIEKLVPQFGMLCVDECHRVPASLFTDVVTAFDSRYSLGLSATAFRRDGLTSLIHCYLGPCVHRIDNRHLHASGAVLKPRYLPHPTSFSYRYRGEYQKLLQRLTEDQTRNRQIADDIVSSCNGDSAVSLVVSDRIAHCQQLAGLLAERNINAAVLTGRLPADERRRLIGEIHAGTVRVVIATIQLIGEGFDCPGLDTLFLTTPIKFTGRLQQVVGRILRPAAGKTATVHDYIDQVGVLQKSAAQRRNFFKHV